MPVKDAAYTSIVLERSHDQPMHMQLTAQLRELILSGRVTPGARLPSSRALADELGVSRITVTTSMDQLVAEGYAQGEQGRGLFVVSDLPDAVLNMRPRFQPEPLEPLGPVAAAPRPFQPAAVDARLFPHAEWAKLLERSWRDAFSDGFSGVPAAGFAPLREAVAHHLHEWRGLACQPAQVFITAGAVDAAQLIFQVLELSGQKIVLEEPGYDLFHDVFTSLGGMPVACPVDAHGLAPENMPPAKLAVATPSRQYPLGVAMPLARRAELLRWARSHGAFIVEDDFDSEYRYRGTPLPALMGLDEDARVIYLGSFSKVFSPALRLGYIAVPKHLCAKVSSVLSRRGSLASAVAQPALAQFMQQGRFATHIRRMRRVYAARQQALLEAVEQHLAGYLEVEAQASGMHLVAALGPKLDGWSDVAIAEHAESTGLELRPLSRFYRHSVKRQGLVMGYSGFDADELDAACAKLAEVLK